MLYTTSLFLRGDQAVAQTVRDVVTQTKNCAFEHLPDESEAVGRIQRGGVGLLLIYLDGAQELDVVARIMRALAEHKLTIPTLALVEHHDADLALDLLYLGVVECVSQPFNTSRLAMLVDLLTVRARYTDPASAPSSVPRAVELPEPPAALSSHVIVSPAAKVMMDQICMVAPLDSTVLLTGETGTGKTSLARVIHSLSPRKNRPFFVVNCGALSTTLIESEMFGHARGAFTGADKNRVGKLEACGDGTLLLDEIDSLPLSLQAKLLRVVEERVFEPVGSNQILPMRARLIVATNRSLEAEVAAGRFRGDLFFRLNVLDLTVPPLRERREAIPHLTKRLLGEFNSKLHRHVEGFSAEAGEALLAYEWPGNVRELRNVLERAVALNSAPVIELSGLPEVIQSALRRLDQGPASAPPGNRLAQARHGAETRQITEALERHNNNRSHVAAALGISRVTLYKKLRKYGLT